VPFSKRDSKAIETAYQNTSEDSSIEQAQSVGEDLGAPNTSFQTNLSNDKRRIKVPVNEDYLFDVDVENRELGPAYWYFILTTQGSKLS